MHLSLLPPFLLELDCSSLFFPHVSRSLITSALPSLLSGSLPAPLLPLLLSPSSLLSQSLIASPSPPPYLSEFIQLARGRHPKSGALLHMSLAHPAQLPAQIRPIPRTISSQPIHPCGRLSSPPPILLHLHCEQVRDRVTHRTPSHSQKGSSLISRKGLISTLDPIHSKGLVPFREMISSHSQFDPIHSTAGLIPFTASV